MKKYLLVFSQSFSDLLAYRAGILLQLFQNSMPALITLLVLTHARSGHISSSSLISYYLFVTVTAPIVISNIDEVLDWLSTSGEINNFLTKPISLINMLWIKNLSEKMLVLLIVSPIMLVLLPRLGFSWQNLFIFFLSLPISFSLSYLFSFIIGLGCFWLDEFWAIRNVKYVSIQLFGGLIIPYSIMPEALSSIVKFTPFQFLGSWSGRILQSGTSFLEIFISICWLIILYYFTQISLRSALRHYSHTGS